MKKAICCLIFLSLIISASVVVHADSLSLSESELADAKENQADTVIKLYDGVFMHQFAQGEDILDILETSFDEEYMVMSLVDISYKHYYEGKLTKISSSSNIADWSEFVQYAISPDLVFDASVEVHNTYCLNGAASHDGVYIYFNTSIGDYVLYKEYLSSENEYLFPVDAFYGFSESVYADRMANRDSDGGSTPIEDIYNLDQYKFQPKNRVGAMAVCAVLVATLISVCVIVYKKRKNTAHA